MSGDLENKLKSTDIVLVVDDSGSMTEFRNATVSSINEFVQQQCALFPMETESKTDCTISLVIFSNPEEIRITHKQINIHEFPKLDTTILKTIGMTALYDAMNTGLTLLPENKDRLRIYLFITDGFDNMSKIRASKIRETIEKRDDQYNKFIYIGACQDAILTAKNSFGIKADHAMSYNCHQTPEAYRACANLVKRMATGDDTQFTQEDRLKSQPQNDWDIVSPSSIQ
jgi:uncharacterized protein with von Willebrand factor type A (vWA) domain